VIRIENLHFRYPVFDPSAGAMEHEQPWALADIDLDVAEGEFLGVCGTTGSGKSTLCMALNGLVPQHTSGTIRGDVWIDDLNTKRTPVSRLATKVGMVFQDPEANLLGLTVEDELAFGPENLAVDPREIEERITWALDVVGMTAHRDRSAAQLSGGQKQRVGIASVLAMQPEVIVLDEPTTELDPVGRHEITSVIAGLRKREQGITIVMVESDAAVLARLADRVAVLNQGLVVALDEPGRLYRNPLGLMELGVTVPAVSEIAVGLNQRLGTQYEFSARTQALEVLLLDHRGAARCE
jgi:energy-coupling factor transporter ATP-binding protein EcfA2